MLAPIVLFTYNRPSHTEATLDALERNELANQSDLFIFNDGPRSESDEKKIILVRKVISSKRKFKSISIFHSETNIGLTNSIKSGLKEIFRLYDRAIILEDDIVTSPFFLNFMNQALTYYQDIDKVMHISGWNYPMGSRSTQAFLWGTMNCWGWATWREQWSKYQDNINTIKSLFSEEDIYKFNVNGSYNFWQQILDNESNKISTWAIFWYASIFIEQGLCLNPCNSYTKNIGNDGSGVNCSSTSIFDTDILNHTQKLVFPEIISHDPIITNKISHLLRFNAILPTKKFPLLSNHLSKLYNQLFLRNLN